MIATAANQAFSVEDAMGRVLAAICKFAYWPLGHLLLSDDGIEHTLDSTTIWHDESGGKYDAALPRCSSPKPVTLPARSVAKKNVA